MKTWHEVIVGIQGKQEFVDLVEKAYISKDLIENQRKYYCSEEFQETLNIIRKYGIKAGAKLVDIGAGNGISSVSFALEGFSVSSIEPDKSDLVGSNAIRYLKQKLSIDNLSVYNCCAEAIELESNSQDIVFARQSMHHASNLKLFCHEIARILKKNALFFTVRDHVVFDAKDKEWFLESHPLHKYYGGENAYTYDEYISAFEDAGFNLIEVYRHYDSVINYYPMTKSEFNTIRLKYRLVKLTYEIFGKSIAKMIIKRGPDKFLLDEKNVPGRLYSFLLKKK